MTADKPADPVAPRGGITVLPPASWAAGAADLLERALYLRYMSTDDAVPVEKAITDHLNHSMRGLAPAPQVEPLLRAALVNGLAYALARADLPSNIETSRGYAERLAPLIVESGFLQASLPTAQPSPLDVGLPPLTDEQADEGERRLHEAGPFADPSPASGEGRDSE